MADNSEAVDRDELADQQGEEPAERDDTEWFRGQLEGHYVGIPAGKPHVSQFGTADRYKLRIYRAVIRKIELLEVDEDGTRAGDDAEEGRAGDDGCFYQASIEDCRLLGIRRRSCFEGPIYDVTVSGMTVTHSIRQGTKTYGRLTGEVEGRFLLPPELRAGAAAAVEAEELRETEERPEREEQPLVDATEAPRTPDSLHAPDASQDDGAAGEIEPLHPPTPPSEEEVRLPANVPIGLLTVVVAIALGLSTGAIPALIWFGFMFPVVLLRYAMQDLFEVTDGQRIFGAVVVLVHCVCLGAIAFDWSVGGCKSVPIAATLGLGLTVLVAGCVPSPAAILSTGAGLAVAVFAYFGTVGFFGAQCDPWPVEPALEEPAEPPTVEHPGIPRTNEDGSWPRRPQ